MSDRFRIVEHKGARIVLQDFSHVRDAAQSAAILAEARRFIQGQRPGEALVLTDVTGSSFDRHVVERLRSLADHHRPWVKASAVVGLSPVTRPLLRSFLVLIRREIRLFGSREEALDWLASAGAPSSSGETP